MKHSIRRMSPEDHVLTSVLPDPDACWPWNGHMSRNGYGVAIVNRNGVTRKIGAHRFAYEMLREPIWRDMTLDHVCRNPKCINPNHMEQVTVGENVLRGNGWSAKNARKTHCKYGHPLDGDNLTVIVRYRGLERRCKKCHVSRNMASERKHLSE